MGMAQSGKAHIACKRYGGCKRYGCCKRYDCREGRARPTGRRTPHRRQSLLAVMVLMLSGLSLSVPAHAACPSGFNGTAVFGIDICAGKGIAAGGLAHAAAVMTGILDFDGDGAPDNAAVVRGLAAQQAAFVVVSSERQARRFARRSGRENFTIVFDDEMVRRGPDFDPTLEEALHLVTQFSYAETYPEDFGEYAGSRIADLMDIARGGRFARVPHRYPANAVYHYDDRSCDYACQVTEFTYLAITSMRGQQQMPGRAAEIDDEWQLNSRAAITAGFPELAAFLAQPAFALLP